MTGQELIDYGVSIGWLSPEKAEQLKKEFPEVVRCKDCRFCTKSVFCTEWWQPTKEDGYCYKAKAKDGKQDGT